MGCAPISIPTNSHQNPRSYLTHTLILRHQSLSLVFLLFHFNLSTNIHERSTDRKHIILGKPPYYQTITPTHLHKNERIRMGKRELVPTDFSHYHFNC